jgi:WD40 repeat protein/uncharacterized caspase-like protein
MCPSVKNRSHAPVKLWILLVGVNQYRDETYLPSLEYSAVDCQGLGEALTEATETFPAKEVIVHHDFAPQKPDIASVKQSLQKIVDLARPDDTILVYFSGHGILETETQQVVLCLADTEKENLLSTGLALNDLLDKLDSCAASQQLVWLDACHSGGMTLRGAARISLTNPTDKLVRVLRRKASESHGFYALLSCDRSQQSWEFPELGHGVFTYYLMRGLRGEAADAQGFIEADALYQYVYYQTLRYIDKSNQQIRLINQQKSSRGESKLQLEFSQQTPKRIVEGFGKVILGKRSPTKLEINPRQALVIDGFNSNNDTVELSKLWQGTGGFTLKYFPQIGQKWSQVKSAIETSLQSRPLVANEIEPEIATVLLYLRGRITIGETGDSWLILKDGVRLGRSWLRKVLKNSRAIQQIVILDCFGDISLEEWVEDLRLESDRGQCLIAATTPENGGCEFTKALLSTLENSDTQAGMPVAAWITQLQIALAGSKIDFHVWLSGTRGVIEVLPAASQIAEIGLLDIGICPYMGLKAFQEDNAQYFYGRENLVRRLLNQIAHQTTMAVVGASGSGKSSALQAGVISQLRRGRQIPGSDRWWIGCVYPGNNPIEALAKILTDSGTPQARAKQQLQLEGLLYEGVTGFVKWLRSRSESMVLLAIDRFEELFTLTEATARQQFLDLILGAIEQAGDRFKLIIVVRADFVASCLEIPELAAILQRNSLLVPPYLTPEDYRRAIVTPAEQVGLQVEPGLTELLLQDLNDSTGDLPLLQFVLQQLWERRQQGKLTLEAYQELGGIKGALERQAQAVYEGLAPEAQDCAKWIFLNLTQLGEGTEDTRRRVTKSDLVVKKYPLALIESTLQTLTSANLLVFNLDSGINSGQSKSPDRPIEEDELFREAMQQAATVEVVHEILIRHWSTLRWWLEENRSRLRSQRQIEQAALLWQQKDRQPDFLLRGVRLAEAEEIYIKYTDELSNSAQEFVAACIDARLADLRAAKKRLRQARLTAATLGILGLVATFLGGIAYRQKLLTQIETIDVLNASSEALLTSNRQLESLLASIKAGKQVQNMGKLGQTLIGKANWEATAISTASTLQQSIDNTQELNRLQDRAQQVNAVTYSPDGKLIATASDDRTVAIWQSDGKLIETITGDERFTSVAFSYNDRLLAAASADRSITIWEISHNNAKQVQKILGHQDWVTSVAFSPDDRILVSASRDRTIRLWNKDGTAIATLTGHRGWVNKLAFSPKIMVDGRTLPYILASGSDDNTVKLWQIDSNGGKQVAQIENIGDGVTGIDLTVDYDSLSQELLEAKSPIGQISPWLLLATASNDGVVKLWQVQDRTIINSYRHPSPINRVVFSPDGKLLAMASTDGSIDLWEKSGIRQQILRGHGGEVLDLSFRPQSQPQNLTLTASGIDTEIYTLASSSADKTVKIWQIPTFNNSEMGGIYSIAVNPQDNRQFATGGWDGKIQLWRIKEAGDRQLIRSINAGNTAISQVAFSPDGKLLASANWNRTIGLWDAQTGKSIATLTGHRDGINSIAWSNQDPESDSYWLVSGSEDKTVKIWQIINNQPKLLHTLTGHQDSVKIVAFSPDGRLIASGSYDKTIKLWQIDGRLQQTLTGHKLAITSLSFSSDGRTLASGSADNTIKLWQINRDRVKLSKTLTGHQMGITSLAYSSNPNLDWLASASSDRTIKLWNPHNGILLKTLQGHPSQINSLAVVDLGQSLLSADEQEGLYFWNLDLEKSISQGCARLNNYLLYDRNLSKLDRSICN